MQEEEGEKPIPVFPTGLGKERQTGWSSTLIGMCLHIPPQVPVWGEMFFYKVKRTYCPLSESARTTSHIPCTNLVLSVATSKEMQLAWVSLGFLEADKELS